MQRNLLMGLLAALAATLIASGWQLVSRHGVTTALGPLELALLRYGIPALVLCPLQWRRGFVPAGVSRGALAMQVIGGGLPFGLLVLAGAQRAPAAHMGVLMAGSMPLFTAAGAWLLRGDKVGGRRLLGLAGIACGMLAFAIGNHLHGASPAWRGDALFLAAAMLWAGYTLSLRASGMTPWQGAAFVNGCSALLLLPFLLALGAPRLASAPWREVALQALGQGVLAGMLGLVAYTAAVTRLGASRASLSAAPVPVLTALGAAWLMDEQVTNTTWFALALVIPGVVLAAGASLTSAPSTAPADARSSA